MPGEILPTPGAGRNRDCSGAERFSAGYIARRIADHVNFGGGKFAAMFFFRPRARKLTQLIAIVVIVRERTEFEKVPDAVMVELQLRAARNVAGKQTEHNVFSRFEFLEQLEDAGKEFAFASRQLIGKKVNVAVEKGGDI